MCLPLQPATPTPAAAGVLTAVGHPDSAGTRSRKYGMQTAKGILRGPRQDQKQRRMLNQLSSRHNQQRRQKQQRQKLTQETLHHSRQTRQTWQKQLHCRLLLQDCHKMQKHLQSRFS